MNYEKGANVPDSNYLKLVALIGVDVMYVLMGQRMVTNPEAPGADEGTQPMNLNERQRALIQNYDAADEVGKGFIEGTASFAAEPKARRASGGSKR